MLDDGKKEERTDAEALFAEMPDEAGDADEQLAAEAAAGESGVTEATVDDGDTAESGGADASPDADAADDTDDADEALFFDLPDEASAEDDGPAADVAEETAAPDVPLSEEDELLAAVELELSPEEQAEIERRSKMKWFVIHANTGHENKVKRNIEMAVKSNHMEEFFGDVLVATQEVTEMKNGKRSTVKRKFFPSYILVEMIMNKETQHFINSIPGVTRFIGGTALKPQPITREEVDRILGRLSSPSETKEIVEIPYQVGDSVQVMDGPFTEWVGVVNEINHDKGKLKVMISIFGSETPVELDFLQVKPV